MGCGQAVRRLALDEEILGSNPSIPAKSKSNAYNISYGKIKATNKP